jgi:hypothetical protein
MTETCSVKYDFNKLADFIDIRAHQLFIGSAELLRSIKNLDRSDTPRDAKYTYEDYNYN